MVRHGAVFLGSIERVVVLVQEASLGVLVIGRVILPSVFVPGVLPIELVLVGILSGFAAYRSKMNGKRMGVKGLGKSVVRRVVPLGVGFPLLVFLRVLTSL